MYVVVPPWFQKAYTTGYKNLVANRKRIITALDVHKTLRYMLARPPLSMLWNHSLGESEHKTGISLFNKIPWYRTCEQAGIPETYCTCNYDTVPLSGEDSWVMEAATFAVRNTCKIQ